MVKTETDSEGLSQKNLKWQVNALGLDSNRRKTIKEKSSEQAKNHGTTTLDHEKTPVLALASVKPPGCSRLLPLCSAKSLRAPK